VLLQVPRRYHLLYSNTSSSKPLVYEIQPSNTPTPSSSRTKTALLDLGEKELWSLSLLSNYFFLVSWLCDTCMYVFSPSSQIPCSCTGKRVQTNYLGERISSSCRSCRGSYYIRGAIPWRRNFENYRNLWWSLQSHICEWHACLRTSTKTILNFAPDRPRHKNGGQS
jgi:hypothetical protein